ncbi:dipeptidase [Pseudoroseomonas cervicalis]|uniref:Peptidase dimerization domain protein n=1 Tax=Pseudoroseomonas cervicalis ATCC 49957 TaxID=525371 RepID=D5RPF1_9PROT|nr:dipeptidase [Pseudoroseomonas cervicalis]EFH10812.1 peptidase dimerization domain protein [Pseudoroseomonas cervicalis ATCC 49957]
MSTDQTARVLAALDSARAETEASLIEWLRIPSVSAQPAHAPDCRRAAEWLLRELAAIGFTGRLRETPGHPVVIAHHPGTGAAPGAKPVLIYGHYDVQPPEPLELWSSPPFEPVVSEGPRGPRLVARGAVDDKGQVMTWLAALRAWHTVAGGPPLPVTVLVEGEEEIGSTHLDAVLEEEKAALAADFALISDTNMWAPGVPGLTVSLRGLAYVQIDLRQGDRDLHSGLFGGSAGNVLNLLTRILGELKDEQGRIQIPGFYDGVAEPSAEQRAAWEALGFDEAAFLGAQGLSVPGGEAGRSAPERLWARPTADINGIWGGYMGEGSKTVIACEGHAKLSCRLVPGQDPARIVEGIRSFVQSRLPADAQLNLQVFGLAPGVAIPTDSPAVTAARAALEEEFGRPAVLSGGGGSIPVVSSLKGILGLDSLLMGFGLDDDQVHSPNEKFELACLHQGSRSHARLLGRLATRG